MNSDTEQIGHRDFDQWLEYGRRDHASALRVIQWLAPFVTGLSHRAENAREILGEDYGELPTQVGNPLYWIAVEGIAPRQDLSGRWTRGASLLTPEAKKRRAARNEKAWAALQRLGGT
jgi:hypothetical protein